MFGKCILGSSGIFGASTYFVQFGDPNSAWGCIVPPLIQRTKWMVCGLGCELANLAIATSPVELGLVSVLQSSSSLWSHSVFKSISATVLMFVALSVGADVVTCL